jgi:DNA (cytosine-5)-methyltransferase 1
MSITVGDMFSGGGGWSLGATAAGCTVSWAIEHDPAVAAIYARNLGDHVIVADARAVDPAHLAPVDILLASPPCQAYSVARRAATTPRTDGDLGDEVIRFVRALKPPIVLVENVPPYQHAPVFARLRDALAALGYWLHWSIVDAADYGVPQNRRRLILRACRTGMLASLPAPTPWRGWYEAVADLIPTMPVGELAPWQVRRIKLPAGATAYLQQSNAYSDGLRYRTMSEPAFTITSQCGGRARIVVGGIGRQLPVAACLRLQTFPDWYQGTTPRILGNAVPPPMAAALVRSML